MSIQGGPAAEPLRQADQALRRGDTGEALRLLRGAEAANPADAALKLQIALALRLRGDLTGALGAIDAALAIEPYLLMAHLSKAFVLEKLGRAREAAESYKVALRVAPAEDRIPPPLRPQLEHAREVVARQAEDLDRFITDRLKQVRERYADERLDRFDLCQDVFVGKKRVFYPEPVGLNFPQLPPIQFHPREDFPWLSELEAATGAIQQELRQVLARDRAEFAPYVQYRPGEPLNQWTELNHSTRWSTFFLWQDGRKIDLHCERCPNTTALLERLPMQHHPGYSPTAMFSALNPRTRIPPHTGSANTRLIVHLPLILPGQCFFRVGSETREWKMGEAWVFDDTIEHEAWNDSDEERLILIFDIWNPQLSVAERELVVAMMEARAVWMAQSPSMSAP